MASAIRPFKDVYTAVSYIFQEGIRVLDKLALRADLCKRVLGGLIFVLTLLLWSIGFPFIFITFLVHDLGHALFPSLFKIFPVDFLMGEEA